MQTKRCVKCGRVLPIDLFYFRKVSKDGHASRCKECAKQDVRDYSKTEKGKIALRKRRERPEDKIIREKAHKKYRQSEKGRKHRKEHYREYTKTPQYIAYRNSDAYQEKLKIWKDNHKEEKRVKDKEYREKRRRENPQAIRDYFREYQRGQRETNENFVLAGLLRARLNSALKAQGVRKQLRAMELLGCSIDFFKTHISSLFQEGMSWDNRGLTGWHLDHIIPCKAFDLRDKFQQQACFNWRNMQPLTSTDNLSKNDDYTEDDLQTYLLMMRGILK